MAFPMLGLLYRVSDALRRRALAGQHGRVGEDLAHRYLRGRGCTVVARNYRPRSGVGEIDLVAWHGKTLAFVEVKTRAGEDFGPPESALARNVRPTSLSSSCVMSLKVNWSSSSLV